MPEMFRFSITSRHSYGCKGCKHTAGQVFNLKEQTCVYDMMLLRERAEAACVSCCGPQGSSCTSLDCPSLYRWTYTLVDVGKRN